MSGSGLKALFSWSLPPYHLAHQTLNQRPLPQLSIKCVALHGYDFSFYRGTHFCGMASPLPPSPQFSSGLRWREEQHVLGYLAPCPLHSKSQRNLSLLLLLLFFFNNSGDRIQRIKGLATRWLASVFHMIHPTPKYTTHLLPPPQLCGKVSFSSSSFGITVYEKFKSPKNKARLGALQRFDWRPSQGAKLLSQLPPTPHPLTDMMKWEVAWFPTSQPLRQFPPPTSSPFQLFKPTHPFTLSPCLISFSWVVWILWKPFLLLVPGFSEEAAQCNE